MGNSDIRDLSVINKIDYDEIAGSDVAVDAANWMYKYMTTTVEYTNTSTYTTSEGEEVPELFGCFRGLKKFKEHNLNAVFVFDGAAHDLKEDELQRRREQKEKAESQAKQATDEIQQAKYDSRTQRLTSAKIERVKKLVSLCGFETVQAPSAAEAQTAYMSQQDSAIALSNDYDSVVFNANKTLRNFTSSSRPLELIDTTETLSELEISHEEFIWAVLLCGTDYNDGVYGVGPATAVKKVSQYDSFESLLNEEEYEIENWEEILNIYQTPNIDTTATYSYPTNRADIEELENYLINLWELPADELEPTLDFLRENESNSTLLDY